jgi:hypothetical protein
MAKKDTQKSTSSVSGNTGAVVGAAATAAAAAAAAYWFYGAKDAARHRKNARSWMLKARAETMEAVEMAVAKLGDIDKEKYMQIVDGIVKRYAGMAGVTAAEVAAMTKDLKAAWQHMHAASRTAKGAGKKMVKKAKKAAKKKR